MLIVQLFSLFIKKSYIVWLEYLIYLSKQILLLNVSVFEIGENMGHAV